MATMTAITTDKRIDDLAKNTDQRFDEQARRTDQRFDEQARQTDQRFDRVEADIRELRTDARDEAGAVRGEFQALRSEMNNGFAALDAKFDAKFDSLNKTIIWLLGGSLSVVTAGILAAVFHALF